MNMGIRAVTCIFFALQHHSTHTSKSKSTFLANLVNTVGWIVTKLLLGRTYLLVTAVGTGAIFVVHRHVMPMLFGSLWVVA